MSFNMVANQVLASRVSYAPGKHLEKIVMSEDKKNVKNMTAWDEKLRTCFTTHNLIHLLQKFYGIEVPAGEAAKASVDEKVEALLTKVKKESRKEGVVKTEKGNDKAKEEERKQKDFESLVKERAKEMADAMMKSNLMAEKRGVRQLTCFVDPLTSVDEHEQCRNTKATHLITFENTKRMYEVESQEAKQERMVAWHLLVTTLEGPKGISKAAWKHIPIGNCYKLY